MWTLFFGIAIGIVIGFGLSLLIGWRISRRDKKGLPPSPPYQGSDKDTFLS